MLTPTSRYTGQFAAVVLLLAMLYPVAGAAAAETQAESPGLPEDTELIVQVGYLGDIRYVDFSPDGRHVATDGYREAILWDLATGYQVRHFHRQCNQVAFSADGRTLLAGASLWDPATGRKLQTFHDPDGDLAFPTAISPDGRRVADGVSDHKVMIWEAATGKVLHLLRRHTGSVFAVAFSPDGRRLISGSQGREVILWDAVSGRMLWRVDTPLTVVSTAFSPDGKWAVAGGTWRDEDTRNVFLLEVATGKLLRTFQAPARTQEVRFSPDGREVVCRAGLNDVSLVRWEAATGKRLPDVPLPSTGKAAWAISPNGRILGTNEGSEKAVIVDGSDVRPWRTARAQADYVPHQGANSPWDYSADGRWLWTRGGEKTDVLWDLAAARPLRTESKFTRPTFGPRGRTLLAGRRTLVTGKGEVVLQETASGKTVWSTPVQQGDVESMEFSADGKQVVVAACDWYDGDDGETFFCDARTGKRLQTFFKDEYPATIFARLSPDGKVLLAGSTTGGNSDGYESSLWDMATGMRLRKLQKLPGYFWHSWLVVDGRQVVAGRTGGLIALWDAQTGRLMTTFPGNLGTPTPDGRRLMAIVDGEGAVLWDIAGRRQLKSYPLEWFSMFGYCHVLFRRDGKRFAVPSRFGCRIFDVASGKEIARLLTFDGASQWLITTPEGYYTGSPEGCKRVTWLHRGKMYPVEKFAAQMHRPEMVARALMGKVP